MTVEELIRELQTLPPHLAVLVEYPALNGECANTDASSIDAIALIDNFVWLECGGYVT